MTLGFGFHCKGSWKTFS